LIVVVINQADWGNPDLFVTSMLQASCLLSKGPILIYAHRRSAMRTGNTPVVSGATSGGV
jgi:hypothetical protein